MTKNVYNFDNCDEFRGRDIQGLLLPSGMARPAEEDAERQHYFKLFATFTTSAAPIVCSVLLFAIRTFAPDQAAVQDSKITFIHENQLGWVFLAWYALFITRLYMALNANGARAACRLGRPDQHVYKIMSDSAGSNSVPSGTLADAPYVLMAGTGAVGRFNRAQRAAANMDESIALFATGTLLSASVFGPLGFAVALLQAWGRITFANKYKEDAGMRLSGFIPAIASEHIGAALILYVGVRGVTGFA